MLYQDHPTQQHTWNRPAPPEITQKGKSNLDISCCLLSYLKHSALKHSNTQPRNIISTIENFIIIGCIPGPMKHRTTFTTSSSPCTANVLTSLPACCSAVEVLDQGKLYFSCSSSYYFAFWSQSKNKDLKLRKLSMTCTKHMRELWDLQTTPSKLPPAANCSVIQYHLDFPSSLSIAHIHMSAADYPRKP